MKEDFKKRFQQKYPHLEVSILSLSEAEKDNETKRIDSEFFIKKYIENEILIKNFKNGFNYLDAFIVKISGGATPLGANYPENGIPFLRVQNIMENYFSLDDVVYISAEDDEILKRSRLKSNDVLLTITGAYGKSAVVEDELVGANINQHSVKIEVKNINPYFLSTFLNSKFGKLQSDKRITGVTRPALDYLSIKTFLIPNFDYSFQKEIENIIKDSHSKSQQSKSLYKEAESILYTELGLDPQDPLKSILEYEPTPNVSVHSLKESFLKTGRLDSEYYQLKYDLMEEKLKSKGFTILRDICSLINYGSVPTSPYSEDNEGIPYIKGLNLKNLQVNENKLDRITNTQDLNEKFFTKENDIIISQMRTVGDCGVVAKHQENYIFASFTIRIRLKNTQDFNPYFVALYIQNLSKEWYLYRNIAQASVRQNTDLPTINNLYIPLIDIKIQNQIADHIQKSFDLRKEAKDLLQKAKEQVENAINEGGGA